MSDLKNKCVITVFTKDNEITISHTNFIETAFKAIQKMLPNESFCRNANGDINVWEFYNLLTGSNKASYIDTFLDRGVMPLALLLLHQKH